MSSANAPCVCPKCGTTLAVVSADAPAVVTAAVSKIVGIGLARTRHDPAIEIVRRTAAVLGVTPTAILSTDRHRSVAFARHLAMYVIRRDLERSYPEIADIFGQRDHSGAMYACRRIVDMQSEIVNGAPVFELVEIISTGRGIDDVTLAFEDSARVSA